MTQEARPKTFINGSLLQEEKAGYADLLMSETVVLFNILMKPVVLSFRIFDE